MEIVNRESFTRWAEKHNWLKINESASVNGRQATFLTPAGNMTVAVFDLKGNLTGLGQPVPTPASALGK